MEQNSFICVSDLHKAFGSKKVLQGVNLDITEGQSWVVLGGSGTGKSVLIKHIIGLLTPDKGRIFLFGREVTHLPEKEWKSIRSRFGMLFQGGALFDSMNVAQNVGFALQRSGKFTASQVRERVLECLELVGLKNVETLSPSELSGGMKKRVALARAIAYSPDVLLYDEPTTGLDPIMSDVINNLIVRLKKTLKKTSIAITHDLNSAFKIADKIAMLYQGKIIETGTPAEIKASKNPLVHQFIHGLSQGPYQF